jgi:hypothetical protein
MTEFKSYEKLAIEAILNGGNFNGKFYGKFIYVSNKKYQIDNKDAFLEAIDKKSMSYNNAFDRNGFDFAEEGNY